MNTIHNNIKLLQKYVLFQLDEDKEFEIQEHLAGCDECSALVHQLRLVAQENRRLHEEWKNASIPATKPDDKNDSPNARESGKVIPLRLVLRYAAVLLPILFLIGGGSGYLLNEKRLTELPSTNEVPSDDNQIEIVEVRKQFEDSIKAYAYMVVDKDSIISSQNSEIVELNSKKNEIETKFDVLTNSLVSGDYVPKINANTDQIIKGPERASGAGKSDIDKSLVGGIANRVYWQNEGVRIINSTNRKIKIRIYSNSNLESPNKEFTLSKDTSIVNLSLGIKYFSLYDDVNAFISGGIFWVLPKPE
ncbi:MAG: hypothetical protein IH598_00660 [Bacteroidales bacterium]|nr:hypothetical protein [Bacteroidales bacterium]